MCEIETGRRRTPAALFVIVLGLITAGLLLYSQTKAFAWDEGYHILVAQLILRGKRPYIDFIFSQTPLNAYWNAGWMAIFGETWRVPHAIAALCSAGAVIMTSGFVFSRFPVSGWRLPGALTAALLVGLNVLVVRFSGVAQAYGLCLLATVAAYCFAVRSAERRSAVSAGLAGLACGIAADSSLLTAPVAPILLIWILVYCQSGLRRARFAAFVAGGAAAFLPVFWLFPQGPRQVFLGIVQYNGLYRQLEWSGALKHNLTIETSWIDSGPALLLLLLSTGGLLFVRFRSGWEAPRKAEFYLCAWLTAALTAYISIVLPTFARYYMFTVPFLGILAVAGVFAAGSGLYRPSRPWAPVLVLAFLLSFGLAKAVAEEWDNLVWHDLEKVAKKVNEVTTPQQTLFADEAIYFLTRHTPLSGMEMEDSHKFNLPAAQNTLLHLIPRAELDRRARAGEFNTLETCDDEDEVAEHGYAKLYAKSAGIAGCKIFWERKPAGPLR